MLSFLNLSVTAIVSSLLIFVSISYVLIGAVVNYCKLRQFQGPPLAGFSRLWLFWQSVNARVNKAQFDAIERYGPVSRIGPNLLVTNDLDIIHHMSAPRSKWTRSEWYHGLKFDPRLDSVFSTQDEKLHAELRAKEAGGYQGRGIDSMEPDIDTRTVDFINLIKSKYDGESMDFALIARFYTQDVLSTVAFGKPFGFLEVNDDLWDYGKTTANFVATMELSCNHKFFNRILSSRLMQALAAPKVTDKVGLGPAVAFARNAVAERFGPDAKVKKDLLGHFVTKGLTQTQCEVEAFLQITAGSDSTTTILRCAMFMLAGNPAAYARLKTEIDNAVESGHISRPVIKYSEAQKLPYLQACIWEACRMFPPLFGLQSKVAPPGGETIKGIFFPGGTEVSRCDDSICRRKDIFGDDSHIYRPERWLGISPETRLKYERTAGLIFGSGRYLCLGKRIALMELNKSIPELIRHFDWMITDPLRGIDTVCHMAHVQSNMNMVARARFQEHEFKSPESV